MFWKNFLVECAKVQKTPAVVVEEIGLSNSMPTSWKKGVIPQKKNQEKIAKYFGITVEELMGTKKEPTAKSELGFEWPDVEEAFKNATPEMREAAKAAARAAAKAAALAVLESKKEG